MFEKEIINIDIKYLWNVYMLKMKKLASLEIALGNNMLNGESLILMSEGLKNLVELRWVVFDLVGNEIDSVNFELINNNWLKIHEEC